MLPGASPKHADIQNYKLVGLLGQLVLLIGAAPYILTCLLSLPRGLSPVQTSVCRESWESFWQDALFALVYKQSPDNAFISRALAVTFYSLNPFSIADHLHWRLKKRSGFGGAVCWRYTRHSCSSPGGFVWVKFCLCLVCWEVVHLAFSQPVHIKLCVWCPYSCGLERLREAGYQVKPLFKYRTTGKIS